mgnify:CR=1 FL=1
MWVQQVIIVIRVGGFKFVEVYFSHSNSVSSKAKKTYVDEYQLSLRYKREYLFGQHSLFEFDFTAFTFFCIWSLHHLNQ